jgi:hypothetical protein
MGWLFGWNDKASLIRHLNGDNIAGYHKLIANSVRGRCLWQVLEPVNGNPRFIALYLLSKSGGEDWGYKDIDESMGPVEVNCPLSYLELAPEGDTAPTGYSREWRERVRQYHEKRHAGVKINVGEVWGLRGTRVPMRVRIDSVKPLRGICLEDGRRYKLTRSLLDSKELPNPESAPEAEAA